ncbi:Bicarbonate transporter BicA [Roseovarius gaetbuli]|uniref:Bicarbonate transporter BicA n=1 Tax=Roseovarius gaetbuli TaxID=1356575 RepID=A0A1X6YIR1_9RHOB|nr:SulP family inorganic anion transporter [Roseovarius gaetbuli]SLN20872.1 Bicarbonate transporter BicA [Roseovarius gaetbuli]
MVRVQPTPQTGPAQSALVGAILGIDAAGHCLALATVFFVGGLAAGLGLATAIFLFSTALITLVLFRFGGFRIALGIPQDTTVAILAPAVALVAAAASGPPEAQVATAIAAIGASAVLSGLAFWLVGRLGLGRMLRMFPYPVTAGFLASSGVLLVMAALSILTGAQGYGAIAASLATPEGLWGVVPAIAMALALIGALRIWQGSTPVLVIILLFLAGFYAALSWLGLSRAEATALGLLPHLGEGGGLGPGLWMIRLVDWPLLLTIAPTFAAVILLNLIGVLLNTSGVELATRQDTDENRELRVTGLGNIVIGAMGGITSYLQGGASIIAARLGVHGGGLVFGHVAVLLIACVFAERIVAAVPTFVAAGLLMFIGFAMIEDWLIAARHRLVTMDWLIVVGIVAVTIGFGILPAVAVGLGLAVLGFTFGYMRLPVIRQSFDARSHRSTLDRNAAANVYLAENGAAVRVLQLQGALFFGSVEQLIDTLRHTPVAHQSPRAVILDFSAVNTFDSSACAALEKLGNLMQTQNIATHLTGMSPALLAVFTRWGLPISETAEDVTPGGFRLWPSLDAALEACETALLAALDAPGETSDFAELLRQMGRDHPRLSDLMDQMTALDLSPDDTLIAANDSQADIYFLASGRLAVLLPQRDGPAIRVRSMGPGAVVGELASLLDTPRNANVICEATARVYQLSADTIARLEREDRDLAALLWRILARSVALKVMQTNALLTRG